MTKVTIHIDDDGKTYNSDKKYNGKTTKYKRGKYKKRKKDPSSGMKRLMRNLTDV